MRSEYKIIGFSLIALFFVVFLLVYLGVSKSFDDSLFNLINQRLNVPSLDKFFEYASLYGRTYFWIPVVAILWVFGSRDYKKAALMMAIVFIIIIIVGLAIKAVYFRPRPFDSISSAITLLPRPTDSSFPSGHALIVIGGATVALLMLKKRYSLPLLIEALVVTYSRVYVGLHYPTDILAGSFLGAGIAIVAVYYLKDSKIFYKFFKLINNIYYNIIGAIIPSKKRLMIDE
ncbi:MAG: phosphatase PAP2 family protein [Candidatus Parvarchaeota archaeon]|nr:phosphatase PAP2 family protein [Candidatus Parvarchaeota archaeon]